MTKLVSAVVLLFETYYDRVVLAGDHMQLEPEVVSALAQEKRLNLSLLGRDQPRNKIAFSS